MEQLQNEGFYFNDKNITLSNNKTNTTIYIGDKIHVKVVAAHKDKLKILFSFIEKLEKDNIKIKKIS